MKITAKGEITKKFAKSYKKSTGEKVITATIVVKTGENNGYEQKTNYETNKPDMIETLKKFQVGQKVNCEGYLNCYDGTNPEGKDYAITKINLIKIELQNETEPVTEEATNKEEEDDDLPF